MYQANAIVIAERWTSSVEAKSKNFNTTVQDRNAKILQLHQLLTGSQMGLLKIKGFPTVFLVFQKIFLLLL